MVLIASATSCTPVDTTNINQDKVDYGVIKQAQEKLENDSITPLMLVQTENCDYLVNENLVVVSKYYKDYNEDILIALFFAFLVVILIGGAIHI